MPYLTTAEYLTRFGQRETILFTNEDAPVFGGPPAEVNLPRLQAMIGDAVEDVNGYVANRYSTPLAYAPQIVKGWVAALARYKLVAGTARMNDAIKEAADRVYQQLGQLVAGKYSLPIDEAAPPAPEGEGLASSSNDRPCSTFGGGILDGLTAPFVGRGCDPRWISDR